MRRKNVIFLIEEFNDIHEVIPQESPMRHRVYLSGHTAQIAIATPAVFCRINYHFVQKVKSTAVAAGNTFIADSLTLTSYTKWTEFVRIPRKVSQLESKIKLGKCVKSRMH
jgi:hypothetical protein